MSPVGRSLCTMRHDGQGILQCWSLIRPRPANCSAGGPSDQIRQRLSMMPGDGTENVSLRGRHLTCVGLRMRCVCVALKIESHVRRVAHGCPAIDARSPRPVVVLFMGLTLVQLISGCIFTSTRPELAPDIAPKYGAGQGQYAQPGLDWWRGFRSRELTNLIEEAQATNFDIAAAIGRILQADAQAKIVGAPLLPEVDFVGFAERFKNPGLPERNLFHAELNASYEIDI